MQFIAENKIWGCFLREKRFELSVPFASLRLWERILPHILIIYLRSHPECPYKVQDKRLLLAIEQGAAGADDNDKDFYNRRAILILLSYDVQFEALEAMADKWGIDSPLDNLTFEEFKYVLQSPYKRFKALEKRGLFKDIKDEDVVLKDDNGGVQFKFLKYWEYLVENKWEASKGKVFNGDIGRTAELVEILKGGDVGNDVAIAALNELSDLLCLDAMAKKRLMQLDVFKGSPSVEGYYDSEVERWKQADIEEGSSAQFKVMLRDYLKNITDDVGAFATVLIAAPARMLIEIFEGELILTHSDATRAINQMLKSRLEVVYQVLNTILQKDRLSVFCVPCDKRLYDPSSDAGSAVKNGIISACNRSNYMKVRNLLGSIGFFLFLWAVFWAHDVVWMFGAIAAAFILTKELMIVVTEINNEIEAFPQNSRPAAEADINMRPEVAMGPAKREPMQDSDLPGIAPQ